MNAGQGAPVISFQTVSKLFAGRPALLDVSFEIGAGARVAVLGPNGAGKTTAVRLMTGRTVPSRGDVRVMGTMPGSPSFRRRRARLGIVPQGPGMYSDLTGGEYLELARAAYGQKDLTDVVSVLDLGDHLSTTMSDLSGGFQRRFVLAAALIGDPELLILDEPTVGLDALAGHDLRAYLPSRMLGRTVVLCTHDLSEAQELCEEVVMLRAGTVVVHDSIKRLRELAGLRLRIEARRSADAMTLLRRAGLDPIEGDGAVLVPIASREAVPDILRSLVAASLDIYAADVEEASLEALFVRAMRQ